MWYKETMIINGEVFVINGCLMLIPSFFVVIETVIKCKRNDHFFYFQFVSGGIVLVTTSLSVGMVLGFSAILLPQLEDEDILASKSEEASWIGD